jgi:hypothetical protein
MVFPVDQELLHLFLTGKQGKADMGLVFAGKDTIQGEVEPEGQDRQPDECVSGVFHEGNRTCGYPARILFPGTFLHGQVSRLRANWR